MRRICSIYHFLNSVKNNLWASTVGLIDASVGSVANDVRTTGKPIFSPTKFKKNGKY